MGNALQRFIYHLANAVLLMLMTALVWLIQYDNILFLIILILVVIIDRIEGDFVVVEMEDKKIVNLPRCLIPSSKEGDIISIEIDKEEINLRKNKIQKIMDNLWK